MTSHGRSLAKSEVTTSFGVSKQALGQFQFFNPSSEKSSTENVKPMSVNDKVSFGNLQRNWEYYISN